VGKDNNRAPYCKAPIPYIPEDEKEADPYDGKPPSVKLLLDAVDKAIDNPILQVQHIFNGGAAEHFFNWFQILSSLLEGQSVGEHFRLALQALQGTDKSLWQRDMDLSSLKLVEAAGILDEAAE
jgi:hypothetical protein